MRPLSNHWADTTAFRMVSQDKDKENYVVASGITPSGKIHVGNFREVITVDLVARALEALGKKVRFIYSWDNFDTFRKTPKNLPDPQAFEKYLRKPIARIPDPWGSSSSYAQGRIELFEEELKTVGIFPQFLYQESKYAAGDYAEGIRKALENKDIIISILNEHRSSPLAEDWLPTSIYCSQCSRDEIAAQKYEGEWNLYYKCATCDHEETLDLRKTKDVKLVWRVDWPMRWAYENVDFEPGGKDHSSQGGSYDTGKRIVKDIWQKDAPQYLQYDFVSIKGGAGKMSSSSGELFTLGQVLDVYEPEVVRWIFSNHRPNHDFSISFDEDVFKIYEEFDKCEKTAFSPEPAKQGGKWSLNKRTYELSCSGKVPKILPKRAGFRVLCNRLQICSHDIERTYDKFYAQDLTSVEDQNRFRSRALAALHWLEHHAPEEFKYSIRSEPTKMQLTELQVSAIKHFTAMIEDSDLENLDTKEINEMIWEKVINAAAIESGDFFRVVYQLLIGRDQGPRLPAFIKEIGKERLLQLIVS